MIIKLLADIFSSQAAVATIMIVSFVIATLYSISVRTRPSHYLMAPIPKATLDRITNQDSSITSEDHIIRVVKRNHDCTSDEEVLGVIDLNVYDPLADNGFHICLPEDDLNYTEIAVYRWPSLSLAYSCSNTRVLSLSTTPSGGNDTTVILPPGKYWPVVRTCGKNLSSQYLDRIRVGEGTIRTFIAPDKVSCKRPSYIDGEELVFPISPNIRRIDHVVEVDDARIWEQLSQGNARSRDRFISNYIDRRGRESWCKDRGSTVHICGSIGNKLHIHEIIYGGGISNEDISPLLLRTNP